jgi:hypothetical protein
MPPRASPLPSRQKPSAQPLFLPLSPDQRLARSIRRARCALTLRDERAARQESRDHFFLLFLNSSTYFLGFSLKASRQPLQHT